MSRVGYAILAALACATGLADAQAVPSRVPYVGQLVTDAGAPFGGHVDVTVRIFAVQSGGTQLWSEFHELVLVENGILSLVLGTSDPATLGTALAGSDDLWLEFQLDDQVLLPRQRMLSVPHALYCGEAATLEGHVAGDFVMQDLSGNMGVAGSITASGGVSTSTVTLSGQSAACTSSNEGALRYDADTKSLQLCDGDAWQPVGLLGGALGLDSGVLQVAPITDGSSPGACTELAVTNTGTAPLSGLA